MSIPVSDQSRSKRFYVEALGFTCTADEEPAPGRRFVDLEPPGGGAGVALVAASGAMAPGSVRGLVLAVDDIDTTYVSLRDRGVEFNGPIDDTPYGRFAAFRDPDGNGWVLHAQSATTSPTRYQ